MQRILFILGLLFSLLGQQLYAQGCNDRPPKNIDSLYQANLETKIPLNLILGSWVSDDSLASKISFVDDGYSVNILPKVHVNSYRFRKNNDSISASGGALNWPPYYCILELSDSQTLKILYFNFMNEDTYCQVYSKIKIDTPEND